MYELKSTQAACPAPPEDYDSRLRIEWLKAQLASESEFKLMRRAARVEAEKGMMLNPVSTPEAFALFGTLLGLLPPAAIFYRLFGYGIFKAGWPTNSTDDSLKLFLLCAGMNIVCCLVGRMLGRALGKVAEAVEKRAWGWTFVLPAVLGIFWGAGTGAAGGLLYFVFGAIVGVFFAAPVGAFAFAVFTPFHRMFAWDGMIDVRHLAALLFGVIGTIVSLIMSTAP
jgi:hypothetical protein